MSLQWKTHRQTNEVRFTLNCNSTTVKTRTVPNWNRLAASSVSSCFENKNSMYCNQFKRSYLYYTKHVDQQSNRMCQTERPVPFLPPSHFCTALINSISLYNQQHRLFELFASVISPLFDSPPRQNILAHYAK